MLTFNLLSIATICYLAYDKQRYETKGLRYVEVGSEALLYLAFLFLQSIILDPFDLNDSSEVIEICFFIVLAMLVTLNMAYMVLLIVQSCKEKRRKKAWLAR